MSQEYACTRCRLRRAGEHDCQDRACTCCFGETRFVIAYDPDDPRDLWENIKPIQPKDFLAESTEPL